jgi:hypothetical protein
MAAQSQAIWTFSCPHFLCQLDSTVSYSFKVVCFWDDVYSVKEFFTERTIQAGCPSASSVLKGLNTVCLRVVSKDKVSLWGTKYQSLEKCTETAGKYTTKEEFAKCFRSSVNRLKTYKAKRRLCWRGDKVCIRFQVLCGEYEDDSLLGYSAV